MNRYDEYDNEYEVPTIRGLLKSYIERLNLFFNELRGTH